MMPTLKNGRAKSIGQILFALPLLLTLCLPTQLIAQPQPTPQAFLDAFVGSLQEYLNTKRPDAMDALVRDNKDHVPVAAFLLAAESLRVPPQADLLIGIALHLAEAYERVFGESSLREEVEAFNAVDPPRRGEKLRADSLLAQAEAARQQGRLQEARSLSSEAFDIYQSIGDRGGFALALATSGRIFRSMGLWNRAIPLLEGALKEWREVGGRNRTQEAVLLNDIGHAYQGEGDIYRALPYFEQALELFRDVLHDLSNQAAVLHNLGAAYDSLGQTRRALEYYAQSLALKRKLGNRKGTASTLANLGMLFSSLGDSQQAISDYQEALDLMRDNGDPIERAVVLGNLANTQLGLGKFDEAISNYKEAESLVHGQSLEEFRIRGNLGLAYLGKGDLRQAALYLKTEMMDPFRRALFLVAEGSYQEAIRILEDRLKGAAERGLSEVLLGTYLALAWAYEGLNNVNRARDYYREGAALVEQEREALTEDQREHFFSAKPYFIFTRLTPYEGLIRLSRPEEAFAYAEAMKARRLLEQAAKREAGRDPTVPDSLRAQEEEVARQLSALLKRKDSAIKRNAKQEIEETETALKAARQRRASLIDSLYRQAPEYAAIRYPRPLKVDEVRLRPGEVLIEFALTETTTHAFLLRGNRLVTAPRRDVGRVEVERLVEAYRRQLSEVSRLASPDFDHTSGYRLYELLLKDLLPHVQKDEEIVLVPDGKLALLPFETLPVTPQKPVMTMGKLGFFPAGMSWLGERYRIRYEQSASALTQRRSLAKKVASRGLLALADPIFGRDDPRFGPAAASQPQEIALLKAVEGQAGLALFRLEETGVLAKRLSHVFQQDGVELLTGQSATKGNLLRKDLTGYRYLLFATHGLLGEKVSGLLEPALVLSWAGGRERDTFLTLSEAMTLRLNAEVVALTACETGVGKQVAAEGVMGMGRAFQYPGARSVLVSLWSVAEESTTLLVERFFSFIKAGADPVSALRQARVDLRRAGYEHPFFWSPFILIGGGEAPKAPAFPEGMPRAEGEDSGRRGVLSSVAIASHFVKVKTMGIGGTREGRLTFRNILFDLDSAEPKRESFAQLDEIGKALALLTGERGFRFRIEGHADSTGSEAYNLRLSQRRSEAVLRHIIDKQGIPPQSLRAIGHGVARPVATNETEEGRRLNRRVEVLLDE